MPDAGFHGKIESETETLFPALNRISNSYNQEFTMDGHSDLYVSHISRFVNGSTQAKLEIQLYDAVKAGFITESPIAKTIQMQHNINDLSKTSYDNKIFNTGILTTTPQGIFFKSDGLKMYVVGDDNNKIYQFTLSTAWDVSTAIYDNISFIVSAQEINVQGLHFSSDGTKLYVIGTTTDKVFQYTLSTAWNVSTATYDNISFSVTAQETLPQDIFFKPDGTKLYVIGTTADAVFQYTLSTAWDVSTATYDTISFSIAAQETGPHAIFFKPDGTKLYMIGIVNDTVFQYTLSTAWNVSTATYDNISFSVTSQEGNPNAVFFKSDGLNMYVIGTGTDTVYQYTLSTAWGVSTASFSGKSFGINGQDDSTQDIFFKPDGTKLYIIGTINDKVFQYTLSTAWDVSTASYDNISFSVSAQETTPRDIFFKPDGTKMYIVGTVNDKVFQYTLSTAWDVSTATYNNKSFDVSSEDGDPIGMHFDSTGTKMYMIGSINRLIHQYTLSTAWDVSTATYDGKFLSVTTEDTIPVDISFASSGFIMYMLGDTSDTIFQYTLSTAWDVSTASYDNKTLSIGNQETIPVALTLSSDDTKIYVVGSGTRIVYQYVQNTNDSFQVSKLTIPNLPSTKLRASLIITGNSSNDSIVVWKDGGIQ